MIASTRRAFIRLASGAVCCSPDNSRRLSRTGIMMNPLSPSRVRCKSGCRSVVSAVLGCMVLLGSPPASGGVKTAASFAVEQIYFVPRESEGSWIAVAADRAGRLYASDQYGPIYRLTPSPASGAAPIVQRLPLAIGGVLNAIKHVHLGFAGKLFAFETGMRFFTDHLQGRLENFQEAPRHAEFEFQQHGLTESERLNELVISYRLEARVHRAAIVSFRKALPTLPFSPPPSAAIRSQAGSNSTARISKSPVMPRQPCSNRRRRSQ